MSADDTDFIRKFPDKCCHTIIHNGEYGPCDKVAVAVTTDPSGGSWWPVCAFHTRKNRAVPLAELIRALS